MSRSPPVFYSILGDGDFTLCVRTSGRTSALIQPVRQAMASLDPALPFVEVYTLSDEVDASAAPERLTAELASILAIFAAVLAGVGLYGLLAFTVSQRRKEIGIRVALGASPSEIAGMIGLQALALSAAGATVGIAAAWALAPLAGSILYGVAPRDALSMSLAAAFVVLISLAAAVLPAVRAGRVDAATALRE